MFACLLANDSKTTEPFSEKKIYIYYILAEGYKGSSNSNIHFILAHTN